MATDRDARHVVMSLVQALNDEDVETERQHLSDELSFVGSLGSRTGGDAYLHDMRRIRINYEVRHVFLRRRRCVPRLRSHAVGHPGLRLRVVPRRSGQSHVAESRR